MRTANRLASLACVLVAATACASASIEVPVETPLKPKIDASQFSRVFVAGFVAGGSDDVDANLESVRLIRNQLKNKSPLRVIDADVVQLIEAASKQPAPGVTITDAAGPGTSAFPKSIKEEADLKAYDPLFANKGFWKRIGDDFQGPLIVTGTVMFTPHATQGYVQKEQEVYDTFGRRQVVPVRTYMERKGFILRPRFIFIDGRTGDVLYTETYREEVLYAAEQASPPLSTYFELMDRVVPAFLSTLTSQNIRGTRTLLR